MSRTRRLITAAALVAAPLGGAWMGTGAAAAGTVAQQTPDVYGFAEFYGIPHLGHETAAGTGCGGDGSVGDVIPDGWWRGYVRNVADGVLDFDLVCVYGPNVNPDLISWWTARHPGETLPWVPDGFLIDNSTRTRRVALAPSFFSHGAGWIGNSCPFAGQSAPFDASRDSWIRIVGGQAQWAVSSCAGVPSGPAPGSGFSFPYSDFYAVPRLGNEEVLGTGCGGDGSLGATIPDGLWYGWIDSLGPTSLEFDVACLYTGETAARLQAEFVAAGGVQENSTPGFWDRLWYINNNERTRTVPLAPGFTTAYANVVQPGDTSQPNWPATGYCVPPLDAAVRPPLWFDGYLQSTAAWIMIANGQAQYTLSECPHD